MNHTSEVSIGISKLSGGIMWTIPNIDITINTPSNQYLGSDKFNIEVYVQVIVTKRIVSLQYGKKEILLNY